MKHHVLPYIECKDCGELWDERNKNDCKPLEMGVYVHYKGGRYLLLGYAEHSNTRERMVVYVSLDGNQTGPRLRVRPLNGVDGWNTPAKIEHVDVTRTVQRFIWVGDR